MKFLPNTIINFHAVYDAKWMESALLFLKRQFKIVPVEDIEKLFYEECPLKNACHITFDDGDRSFFDIVFPLLKKHNIPVSIYVSPLSTVTDHNFWFQEVREFDSVVFRSIVSATIPKLCIDTHNIPVNAILKSLCIEQIWELINKYQGRMKSQCKSKINMSVDELRELHASGLVAVGAHTLNHPILANEDDSTSFYEISSSILELSDILSIPIKYFAYPNGIPGIDFGKREMEYLKKLDIRLAFSTENKGFNKYDNVYSVPRNGMSKGRNEFLLLKLILGSRWDAVKGLVCGKQELDYRIEFMASNR